MIIFLHFDIKTDNKIAFCKYPTANKLTIKYGGFQKMTCTVRYYPFIGSHTDVSEGREKFEVT